MAEFPSIHRSSPENQSGVSVCSDWRGPGSPDYIINFERPDDLSGYTACYSNDEMQKILRDIRPGPYGDLYVYFPYQGLVAKDAIIDLISQGKLKGVLIDAYLSGRVYILHPPMDAALREATSIVRRPIPKKRSYTRSEQFSPLKRSPERGYRPDRITDGDTLSSHLPREIEEMIYLRMDPASLKAMSKASKNVGDYLKSRSFATSYARRHSSDDDLVNASVFGQTSIVRELLKPRRHSQEILDESLELAEEHGNFRVSDLLLYYGASPMSLPLDTRMAYARGATLQIYSTNTGELLHTASHDWIDTISVSLRRRGRDDNVRFLVSGTDYIVHSHDWCDEVEYVLTFDNDTTWTMHERDVLDFFGYEWDWNINVTAPNWSDPRIGSYWG